MVSGSADFKAVKRKAKDKKNTQSSYVGKGKVNPIPKKTKKKISKKRKY